MLASADGRARDLFFACLQSNSGYTKAWSNPAYLRKPNLIRPSYYQRLRALRSRRTISAVRDAPYMVLFGHWRHSDLGCRH